MKGVDQQDINPDDLLEPEQDNLFRIMKFIIDSKQKLRQEVDGPQTPEKESPKSVSKEVIKQELFSLYNMSNKKCLTPLQADS